MPTTPTTTADLDSSELLQVLIAGAQRLIKLAAQLDAGPLSATEAAAGADEVARLVNSMSYLKGRLARRAVQAGAHREAGFSSAQAWMAAQGGLAPSEAKELLAVTKATEDMPITGAAMAAGELSLGQASELAKAEAASPGAGEALVRLAQSSDRAALKDAVRQVLMGQVTPEELGARQHKARNFRSWTNDLGMTCFSGALPPQLGHALVNRVEEGAARLKRSSSEHLERRGASEPFEALAADALAALVLGAAVAPTPRPQADVVYVVSYEAVRRGHLHEGEVCHLAGGCPVTLEEVDAAARDAFIKAVLTKGKDIVKVAHFGRHVPAHLRSALVLGPPPELRGAVCSHPGCGRRYGLEMDHVVPLSEHGPTSYENLQPLCKPHHWQKTENDRSKATKPWVPRPPAPRMVT